MKSKLYKQINWADAWFYLYKVNQVLEIQVISVTLDQFLTELVIKELCELVWVDEAQREQGHLGKEENEKAEGVELEEEHVLSQGSYTSSKADNEDDAPNDHEEEADVEHDIEDGLELEGLPTAPLVKGSIDSNSNKEETRKPEEEVEEEHCVVDTGRYICEAAWYSPPPEQSGQMKADDPTKEIYRFLVIPPLPAIWMPLVAPMVPLTMSAPSLPWHLLPVLPLSPSHCLLTSHSSHILSEIYPSVQTHLSSGTASSLFVV